MSETIYGLITTARSGGEHDVKSIFAGPDHSSLVRALVPARAVRSAAFLAQRRSTAARRFYPARPPFQIRDYGSLLLCHAVVCGNDDSLRALLAAGADPNAQARGRHHRKQIPPNPSRARALPVPSPAPPSRPVLMHSPPLNPLAGGPPGRPGLPPPVRPRRLPRRTRGMPRLASPPLRSPSG